MTYSSFQDSLRKFNDKDRYPLILLMVVVFLFFAPTLTDPTKLIWPHSHLGSDISYRHWPDLIRYAAAWREGHVDIWDLSVALGRPLAGDPTVLFLYPFAILFAWLPPAFAFNLLDAVHVFIAGFWTFLFMRRGLGTTRPAALLSGFIFAFAPKYISHLAGGHVGLIWGVAWAPAVFLGLELAFAGNWLGAVLAGLALAIQMPTHLQMPYYTAVAASAYWGWHLLLAAVPLVKGDRSQWKYIRQLLLTYVIWITTFVLAAAAVLFPLLELLPFNSRSGFTIADSNLYSLPPALLITLLVPTNFQFPEWTMFIGLTPLVLAALGWLNRRYTKTWAFFALFTGFALVYSLGTSTPLFNAAYSFIPGFNMLRVPTRLWFLGGLGVAVLAGLGADLFTSQPDLRKDLTRQGRLIVFTVVIYFAGGLIAWIGYRLLFGQWHLPLALRLITAGLLVGAGFLWYRGRLGNFAFQWALVLILLFDLLPLDADFIDLINPHDEFLRPMPVIDYLSTSGEPYRVYSPAGDFPYALAAGHKIDTLEGLLAFQIGQATAEIRTATGCTELNYATAIPPCLTDRVRTAIPDMKQLGLINVRYIFSRTPVADPQLKLVLDNQGYLYENILWQPRVRLETEGDLTVTRRDPGDYEINVEAPQSTSLTVAETWLPGWQATDNGLPVKVQKVEGTLMSIPVKPGSNLIRLTYAPIGWQIGWRTSVIVWVVAVLWLLTMGIQAGLKKRSVIS